jgi:serine phosphatase RsbU (regulator of sigma subunit)/HAMP domain-containing protein
LKTDTDKLHEFTKGSGSIFATLKDEFSARDKARDVLIENAWVSEELSNTVEQLVAYSKKHMTDAISSANSAQQTSIWMIMFIVAISLICSSLIVWRYVGRNLIRRLTEISDSMASVAGGDLRVHLPDSRSNDEIDRMTKALTVFRDTAIEIEENGLREIAQARQRLVDAIESTHEGFVLYDADDRIVLANQRFMDMYSELADLIVPGTPFETLIRAVADRGLTGSDDEDTESWLERRLSFHRDPKGEHVYQLNDCRWVQVTERKTEAGGTVSVFTDITKLKESEQRTAEANRLLNQSLRYASRIQAAILPARRELASVTDDHFLIWEPRDIVGGDFFWFQRIPNGYAIIVGDCTGHGVPGAFMTLVAWGLLDGMLRSAPVDKPSQLLSELHQGVQVLLGQDQTEGDTDDGLDVGVCFVNETEQQMIYAGAKFSLWHADNGSIDEIKGDPAGIGYRRYPADTAFTDVILPINNGARFYMTTDGLIDQVGGPRGRSFGKRRLREFIEQNREFPMANQAERLSRTVSDYQGDQLRRDDLTVMGFVPRAA